MTRPLSIAVTGHRPNRLAVGEARVGVRLERVLRALRLGARAAGRGGPPVAVSALAEGADRLFAAAALRLGFRLEVLLPFPSAEYEGTFSDGAATPVYRALLARADRATELAGSRADSKAAYEAVGHATVAACDILLAVWDGKPAAGRGGSPEIVEHALGSGRDVIWIDAARDRSPRLLRVPTAHGPRIVPLDRLVRRAEALSQRRIVALGRSVGSQDGRLR